MERWARRCIKNEQKLNDSQYLSMEVCSPQDSSRFIIQKCQESSNVTSTIQCQWVCLGGPGLSLKWIWMWCIMRRIFQMTRTPHRAWDADLQSVSCGAFYYVEFIHNTNNTENQSLGHDCQEHLGTILRVLWFRTLTSYFQPSLRKPRGFQYELWISFHFLC